MSIHPINPSQDKLNNTLADVIKLLKLMQKHNLAMAEGYKTPKEEAETVLRILPILEQTVKLAALEMKQRVKESSHVST